MIFWHKWMDIYLTHCFIGFPSFWQGGHIGTAHITEATEQKERKKVKRKKEEENAQIFPLCHVFHVALAYGIVTPLFRP